MIEGGVVESNWWKEQEEGKRMYDICMNKINVTKVSSHLDSTQRCKQLLPTLPRNKLLPKNTQEKGGGRREKNMTAMGKGKGKGKGFCL